MSIDRKDIQYKPKEIYNSSGQENTVYTDKVTDISNTVADKLLEHISIINDYYKRLDSIDYLAKNAEKLAKNQTYETNAQDIIESIAAMGGSGNKVDFELFKQCVDILIESFENMAVGSLTGALND